MEHDVFILSGEFGLPPGETRPQRVFRTERESQAAGEPLTLEHLLTSAGERTLERSGLDPALLRRKITHLLATTMPEVKLEEMNLGLLSTRLKGSLKLPSSCQARFEVGSSDAGASSFATAWHATRGASEPRTTLVLAGQVMPGGSEAIRAISKVLEPAERHLGLNMLAVGDLYMDLFARWWGLLDCAHHLEPESALPDDEAIHRLIETLTRLKLELAAEYLPTNRKGALPPGPWTTHWFRIGHVAPATSGGAAILMTNDLELVKAWSDARGHHARTVRILGVGEGEADTAVTRRPHPLCFLKSIRQALSALGRDAGVNLDFLRACGFALLHDAFLSIETAFLFSLGMTPLEAVQKQLSFWSNPYGGLTAFGHAIGASGLVQIVKAFHIFAHDPELFPALPAPRHPRFDQVDGPVCALATSVGGPLSHVVAALLESRPIQRDEDSREILLPPPFQPHVRHRFNPAVDGDLPQKAAWVQALFELYLEQLGDGRTLGLLEACSPLDLRALPVPLPAAFLEQWTLAPVPTPDGLVDIGPEHAGQLKAVLAGGLASTTAVSALDPTVSQADRVADIIDRITRQHLARAGLPVLEPALKRLRDALFAALRPPMALVVAPERREGGTIRRLALLAEPVRHALPGTLVHLATAHPYPIATASEPSLPGLVPLWDQMPSTGSGPFAEVTLSRAQVDPIVSQLLKPTPGRAAWTAVRSLATQVVRQALARPALPPPPDAVRLLRALVLFPDPMTDRVANYLIGLCSGPDQPSSGRDALVAYCEIDLVGSHDLTGGQLALNMGIVARAVRRAECWLNFGEVNLEHTRDHFIATCPLDPATSIESAWVAMTRFARDVYQFALVRGVHLRAGVSVGLCQQFAGIDGAFGATGVTVRAVQTVLQEAPEARRRLRRPGTGGTLEPPRVCGDGVILVRDPAQGDPGLFDRVWTAVGGEMLEVLGPAELTTGSGSEVYAYQYRARRHPTETGTLRVPTPAPSS